VTDFDIAAFLVHIIAGWGIAVIVLLILILGALISIDIKLRKKP
jgi:hypothetical protein